MLQKTFRKSFKGIRAEAYFIVIAQVFCETSRAAFNYYLSRQDQPFFERYRESTYNDTWFTPIFVWCFVSLEELLPATAQILALNFSFRKDLKVVRYSTGANGFFESLDTLTKEEDSQ